MLRRLKPRVAHHVRPRRGARQHRTLGEIYGRRDGQREAGGAGAGVDAEGLGGGELARVVVAGGVEGEAEGEGGEVGVGAGGGEGGEEEGTAAGGGVGDGGDVVRGAEADGGEGEAVDGGRGEVEGGVGHVDDEGEGGVEADGVGDHGLDVDGLGEGVGEGEEEEETGELVGHCGCFGGLGEGGMKYYGISSSAIGCLVLGVVLILLSMSWEDGPLIPASCHLDSIVVRHLDIGPLYFCGPTDTI